jgi:hypothetical protein
MKLKMRLKSELYPDEQFQIRQQVIDILELDSSSCIISITCCLI